MLLYIYKSALFLLSIGIDATKQEKGAKMRRMPVNYAKILAKLSKQTGLNIGAMAIKCGMLPATLYRLASPGNERKAKAKDAYSATLIQLKRGLDLDWTDLMELIEENYEK